MRWGLRPGFRSTSHRASRSTLVERTSLVVRRFGNSSLSPNRSWTAATTVSSRIVLSSSDSSTIVDVGAHRLVLVEVRGPVVGPARSGCVEEPDPPFRGARPLVGCPGRRGTGPQRSPRPMTLDAPTVPRAPGLDTPVGASSRPQGCDVTATSRRSDHRPRRGRDRGRRRRSARTRARARDRSRSRVSRTRRSRRAIGGTTSASRYRDRS